MKAAVSKSKNLFASIDLHCRSIAPETMDTDAIMRTWFVRLERLEAVLRGITESILHKFVDFL